MEEEKLIEALESQGIRGSIVDISNTAFFDIVSSPDFKRVLKGGFKTKKGPSLQNQAFDSFVMTVWDSYLIEKGYRDGSDGTIGKFSLANKVFTYLREIPGLEFSILDRKKGIGAIRPEGGKNDYEVTVTKHRKKAVFEKTVADKLPVFVQELVDKMLPDFDIVMIKSNQITIEGSEGEQLSVKLTRKKSRLY